MLDYLTRYYGTDWIDFIGTVLGVYLLGSKQKIGFVFNTIAAASGCIMAILMQSPPILILNIILILLGIRGYLKWKGSEY